MSCTSTSALALYNVPENKKQKKHICLPIFCLPIQNDLFFRINFKFENRLKIVSS